MISLNNISKSFGDRKIFSAKELELITKGIIYIYGDSGIGKTTFLNCLVGFDRFDEGSIFVNDLEVKDLKSYSSFVFQDFQLIDKWTVEKNLLLSKTDCYQNEVDNILKKLDIYEIKNNLVYNISAGQKQRVAIARALLQDRAIIILDEPLSNLDESNTDEILKILKELSLDKLIIIVSHRMLKDDYYNQKISFNNKELILENKNENNELIKELEAKTKNKLLLKDIISFAKLFISKSKQSILTMIIFILCFSVLSLGLSITLQDSATQVNNIYQETNQNSVIFCNYNEDFGGIYYSYLEDIPDNSFYTLNRLNSRLEKNDESFALIDSIWYKKINLIDLNNKKYNLKENEILVTKDIEEELNLNINEIVYIDSIDYKVIDFIDESYALKNTIITGFDCYKNIEKGSYSNEASLIDFNEISSCDIQDIKNLESVEYGEITLNLDNEAILSKSIARYFIDDKADLTSLIGKEITLNKTMTSYETPSTLKKCQEKFIVRGITSSSERTIYLKENVVDLLSLKYSYHSIYNSLKGYGVLNPTKKDFNEAFRKGLTDYSSLSDQIKSANGFSRSWNGIIISFSLILGAISLILIIITIKNTMNLNKKELGILILLDYEKNKFKHMFSLQVLFITLCSIIISTPLGIFIVNLFNHFVKKDLQINFSLISYIWYIPFLLLLFVLIFTYAYSYLINKKIMKKKNIEIIYSK